MDRPVKKSRKNKANLPGPTESIAKCPTDLFAGRSTTAFGRNIDRTERNTEPTEPKIAKNFKRPKNREDGSDFDDFLTELIATALAITF